MLTNTALTLYQMSVISNQEVWTRTVIKAVHWENRKAANVIASGLLQADSVSVWVPLKGLQATFKVGDVIVKGEVSYEITDASFTMADLEAAEDNVVRITSVDTYDYGSLARQHIRLGAA